jgi:hypothetical protein
LGFSKKEKIRMAGVWIINFFSSYFEFRMRLGGNGSGKSLALNELRFLLNEPGADTIISWMPGSF